MSAESETSTSEIKNIHARLLKVQRRYRDRIVQELPVPTSTRFFDAYILETEALPFSPQIFRELCLRLAPLLAEQGPTVDFVPLLSRLNDALLIQLASAMQHAPEQNLPLALEMAIEEVRLHKIPAPELEALQQLLMVALMPFYSAFALKQTAQDLGCCDKGWCPVCGQYPINGFNRPGDGLRIMGCWLCETQWSHPRTVCPVCSCQRQEAQLLFTPLGENRARRIQVCDDCGHYLKITDCTEANSELDLQLENSATVHLDVLAQRKGYRPASYPQLADKIKR